MSRAKTKRAGTAKTPPASIAQSAREAVGKVGQVMADGVETLRDAGALVVEKVSELLPGGTAPKPAPAARKKVAASVGKTKPKGKAKSAAKAPKSASSATVKTAPQSKSAVKSPSQPTANAKAKASP